VLDDNIMTAEQKVPGCNKQGQGFKYAMIKFVEGEIENACRDNHGQ